MYVNRVVIFAKPNFPEMVESVKESWSALVGILFTGGLGHLTTVLITIIAGPIHAGYFSAADRLRQMAVSTLTPLGQALFVKINAISAENYRAAWAYAYNFFMIQMFLGMIIATLIFLFRAELIFFLFGNDLMPASNVLAVMAIGFIFTSLNHSLGFQGMISFGIGSVLWKILLVGFSINVGLVVLLISVFTELNSEISGALGMLFSEVLVFILLAFFLIKFQKNMYLK
jgi:O-antigen/teichoic acid export membrane protein